MRPDLIVLRGGGDLASGVALRLHRVGFPVLITELSEPLTVRRTVSFAEAVYAGTYTVEGVTARLVSPDQLQVALEAGEIPVLIDPNANVLANPLIASPRSTIVIDARLLKHQPDPLPAKPLLYIGLGPGFVAAENCDAAIETRRSHTLGRVFWEGAPQADNGQPDGDRRRVLRAPVDGVFVSRVKIGTHVDEGQVIAEIRSDSENLKSEIICPLGGMLRGLIHDGVSVPQGMKIGDVDPRDDASLCYLVSDKALSIGGAVLEAIFSWAEIRDYLWTQPDR
jgi:xanthine dehydrogenase accessory factor